MINVFGVGRLGSETPLPLAGAQALPWLLKQGTFVQETGPLIAHNPFDSSPLVLIENLCSCPLTRYYFTVSFSVCSVPSVTWQAVL